jgi:hypothetical protein
VSRIIRSAAGGLGLAVLSACPTACTLNPPASSNTASAPRTQVTEVPRTPGVSANSVWVLSPLGVNVRAGPDKQSERVTGIAQGARLDISETRKVGADTWLHVRSQSGQVEGWVLDDPTIVTHRAMNQHIEESGYSNLFPAEWTLSSGNPALMSAPAGDPEGGALLIQIADQDSKLPNLPLNPGKEIDNQFVELYGKTVPVRFYRLDAGGYEFALRAQCKKNAYLVDYKQSKRDQPDPTLFKTLLASVKADDCTP